MERKKNHFFRYKIRSSVVLVQDRNKCLQETLRSKGFGKTTC